ncbi:hypothetical protein BKA70DRAFT_1325938, partial [Coprinopsis sp. MPI-PUGE-AT-0042]
MQTCSISSPLASASTLPSSSFSPASPPPLVGTRKKSYAAAVSPSAGLSTAPSAWPALSSAAPVKSPITPVTPKTAAGMTSKSRLRKRRPRRKRRRRRKKKEEAEEGEEQWAYALEVERVSAQSFAWKGYLYGYSPSSSTTMIALRPRAFPESHLYRRERTSSRSFMSSSRGAETGRSVLLFFAGHSTQQPTDSMDEEDGMDELIVTYDNLLIQDDELREKLVKPLPPGVKLTAARAVLTYTFSDLEHFRCNRVWGKRRIRRAAAPLSPRRSPMVLSPMSTSNRLSPIFDYERIGRAFRVAESGRRLTAARATCRLAGDATTGADGTTLGAMDKAQELGRAQERARGLDRPKIVPPPVFNGWERSSMDRIDAPSKGAVRPISILASGPSTVVKAPKIKIKTTSLPLEEVPTRPNAHVTFTPQTYTPQSSRRDSVVVAVAQQQGSRRDSVVESGHGGPVMVGMSQVLEEAFAKHAERKKGDTQLTDRTDKTDRTDRTWPASDERRGRGGGVKSGGPSRMASFGATSSIAVTTTMTAHALNSAAAAAGSPVRALSVSKGMTSEGEKGKKTKRL